MKKVLYISESMGGGLRKHVTQLLNNMNDDYMLYFIHGTKNMDSLFIKEYSQLSKKCKMIPCESFSREISLKNDLKTSLFLFKQIKKIKPDIVHCHSSKAGALGRIVAKICKTEKIFYTPHAYSFLAPEFSKKKKLFFIKTEKYLCRYFTTKTFCVSKNEKKEALRNYVGNSKNIKVIYNGLEDLEYPNKLSIKKSLGIPEDKIIIGNNARLSEQKNPLLFLEIVKELSKENKYHFIWSGDGPLRENIENLIVEYALENQITLLGDRNDSEIIVSIYDYYLSTSLYEGLPYALIEALRAGVPIIATNVVGNNEIVIPNVNGEFINLEINSEMNVLFRKKYKSDLVKNTFKQNFSLEKMISSIKKEYLA